MTEQTTPATAAAPPPDEHQRLEADSYADSRSRVARIMATSAGRNMGLVVALGVMCAIGVMTAGDRFADIDNVVTILRLSAVPGIIATSRVMALTTDARGTLWVCTALKGVMSWDGQALSRFENETDISGKACQSIFTDSQGRIWIGLTSGGTAVFVAAMSPCVTTSDGLMNTSSLATSLPPLW